MTVQTAIISRLQNFQGWRMTTDEHHSENNAQNRVDPESPSQVQQATLVKPVIVKEVGGPKGLEPTRFGDWERNGRCIDF